MMGVFQSSRWGPRRQAVNTEHFPFSPWLLTGQKYRTEQKHFVAGKAQMSRTNLQVGSGNETLIPFSILGQPPTIRLFVDYVENVPFLKQNKVETEQCFITNASKYVSTKVK